MDIKVNNINDLSYLGLDPSKFFLASQRGEWHGPCPFCGGKDRFLVSNGYYYCRQNPNHAGTYEKLRKLLLNDDSEIKFIHSNKQDVEKNRKEAQKKALDYINRLVDGVDLYAKLYINLLESKEGIEYLSESGISLPMITRFSLGYLKDFVYYSSDKNKYTSPAIIFPFFSVKSRKRVLKMSVRIMNPKSKSDRYRGYISGMPKMFYYCAEDNDDPLIFVEGEKKAIILWSFGFNAAAIPGAYLTDKWVSFLRNKHKNLYLWLDCDNDGIVEIANRIESKYDIKRIFVNHPGKPDDLLLQRLIKPIDVYKEINYENL